MDNPLQRTASGPQGRRLAGLAARLQVVGRILDWLAALILLTDEHREEAGVYFGSNSTNRQR